MARFSSILGSTYYELQYVLNIFIQIIHSPSVSLAIEKQYFVCYTKESDSLKLIFFKSILINHRFSRFHRRRMSPFPFLFYAKIR